MALKSKIPAFYGQTIDVNGFKVVIGMNGCASAPEHIEHVLLAQPTNWAIATPADLEAPAFLQAGIGEPSIQDVLSGQRVVATQPAVIMPSQMQQLTGDYPTRPQGAIPPPAPAVPSAVNPQPITPVAPVAPIEPTVQPQPIQPVAPTAPIAAPVSVPTTSEVPNKGIVRGKVSNRRVNV